MKGQHTEQRAWKRKSILGYSYDQQHSWQTFENETEKGNYRYWLQEHDIIHIARVEFGYDEGYRKVDHQTQISEETKSGKVFYDKTSSKTVFVVSDLSSLPKRLANFKDYIDERNELRTFTTILNIRGGHWVALVVANQNGQYCAYYSDSLRSEIIPSVKKELKDKIAANIHIIDLDLKQQEDEYNCGIFALQNAYIMNEQLQKNKPLDEMSKKLSYKLSDEEMKEKRKHLVGNLLKDHDRKGFVIVNFAITNKVKTCLEPSGLDLDEFDQDLLRRLLDLSHLLKSSIKRGYLKIATFALERGADTSDLSIDDKKQLSDYIRKYRIEHNQHINDFLSTVQQEKPNLSNSEVEQASRLSADRVKRVDNDPNQAGSSQQSSSDNVQSGRGTINSVQHQQKRTKTNYEEDKLENSNPKKQKTSSTGRQSMEVDHYSASRKRSHEDEENALQVKRLRLSTCSNLQQSSDIQKNRKPTGLLTSYHGIAYQMQWTMVLALEAQDRLSGKKSGASFGFRVMNFNTEDPDAGKLDDLVWRSETDKPGIYEHNFLQAKHLLDGGVKITFRDLSKLKQKEDSLKSNEKDKRTFSLEKFFLSYRDQIKKNFNGKINKLIIATNIDFDDELRSSFEPLQENIPILNFMEEGGSKKPENLRFKKGDYYRKELAKQFKSAYGSVNLIEELLKDISRNGDVTKESSLSPYFYELLENKVINKSGKFDSSFINNNGLSKKARIFREFLLELGFKDKKENPSNNFNILKPEEFAEEIASLIKKGGEAIIKVERRKEIIRNNIDRLAHYVLVADEQNKVTFSRVFWKEDDKKLPGNLNVFRSKLKDNFINSKLIDENDNGSQIYEKLRKYHFKITGENNDTGKKFTTCRESLTSEEAFWEAMGSFGKFGINLGEIEMIELAKDRKALLSEGIILEEKKFSDSFKKGKEGNLSKKARIFREFLLELGFKDKKENPSNNFNILKLEEFAEEIASLIKKDGEAIIKVERRKEIIRNNIDRLAHYVLVADEQNKVTFSRVFWKEDDKKLPGNLNVFRSKLKDNFINSKLIDENDNGSQIYEKLRKYHFKITGENNDTGKKFTTCRESLASEEAFWEAMEDGSIENNINKILPCENFPETSLSEIKNEIEEFFERLTFVVGYSQEILDEFIKKKCSWFIGFNTDYAAYGLQSRIADIFNLKVKEFISTDEDVAKFFDHARHQLDQLTVAGLTFEYSAQIEDLGVAFSRELSGLIQFLSFGERQIFNLVNPHNTMLSSIKVFQTLNSIPNYQKYDSHIFVCSGFSLSVQDRIINAFRLESNNLIVIECKPEKKDVDQLYCQLSEVIDYYSNKKVILITQGKHPLAAKFEKDYADRYIVEKDERNSLADLTPESQEKLLERENIIFQGETLNLSGLVDILDGELLCKLVNNEKIEIGQAFIDSRYRDVEHCYIDRRFCRNIEIRGDFRKKNPEFFLIDDQKSIEGDPQPGQDIISISDDNKSFSKLRNEYRTYNIHWLKKEKNNFMWQESHGSLLKLRKLVVDTKEQSGKEYKQEEIEVTPDKLVIIAGKAGMGKSIVLNYLALRIKESDPSLWVVRINLLDCVTELETAKASKIEFDEVEAIKFLYRNLYFQLFQSTEEEKQMMENVLSSLTVKEGKISLEDYEGKIQNLNLLEIRLFSHLYNQGKVVLLFDGFDEISPSYGKKVIELLKVLKETKVKKLWITTRPYNIVNKTLEGQLSVFSYQLKPFLQDEQKDFLKKLWKAKYKLSDLDEKRSGVFIDELLNIFSKSIDCQDFLCVPLQISMVAEVFQGIFKEFYDHGDHEVCDIQKQKLSEKMDLSALYRMFVLKKFYEIYFREKISTAGAANPYIKALIDQQYKTFILDHERLAAYMIFKEDKVEDLLSPQEIKKVHKLIRKVKRGEEKTGIIESVVGNVPKFVHRTFAEYFVSELVYRRLQQSLKNLNQSQVSQDKIWEFFLDHILMQDKYDVIRRFINYQLADDKLFRLMEDRQKQLKLGKIKVLLQKVKNGERTQLHLASKEGLVEIVRLLVANRPDNYIDFQDSGGRTSLHFALEGGSLSTFIVLLDNGAYLSIGDNELSRPLHLAAENGYLEFVKALVPYLSSDSVGMNVRNIDGKSALHLAAMNNYQDIVEFLLDYVVSVGKLKEYINAESLFEETPLHLTAIYGCKASASTLLKFANDNNTLLEVINAAGADRYTPLYLAIKNNQFDVVELLLNIAKDNLILTEAINVKDRDKASLLHLAAENGHEDIVKLLLYFAEDTEDFMNAENLSCHTALSLAIENGKENVVRVLLDVARKKEILPQIINFQYEDGYISLHTAAEFGQQDIVAMLLTAAEEKGILTRVINAKTYNNSTPLHLAAENGKENVVRILLNIVKDKRILTELLNAKDINNSTPLHLAVEFGKEDVARILLNIVKDKRILTELLNAKTANKCTPLHLAAENGKENVVRILLNIVKDKRILTELLNAKDIHNSTPLHLAVSNGEYKIVKLLLDTAREEKILTELLNAKDIHNSIPLHLAVSNGEYKIVELLLDTAREEKILTELLNAKDIHNSIPLHLAIRNGEYKIVKLLLDTAREEKILTELLSAKDIHNSIPLHLAVRSSGYMIIKLLLDTAGEEKILTELLSAKDEYGVTPLDLTLILSREGVVRMLLSSIEFTEVISDKDDHELLPLVKELLGAEEGEEVLTKLLLNAQGEDNYTLLHMAARNGEYKIAELLLDFAKKRGVLTQVISAKDKNNQIPLHLAVKSSEYEITKLLLDTAREEEILTELLNAKDINNSTPLHLAAEFGKEYTVNVLLNSAREEEILTEVISAKDKNKSTPLHLVAGAGREDIVNILLNFAKEEGILTELLNSQDEYGITPLHVAAAFGKGSVVTILLNVVKGKEALTKLINAKSKIGCTALHLAASNGEYEIVKILLNAAKQEGILLEVINSQNQDKMTPLHIAAGDVRKDIVNILLNAAKENGILLEVINSQNQDKMTPLHIAAGDGRKDIVNILLNFAKEEGILLEVINSQDKDKMTPLDLAALFDEESIVNMLLKAIKEERIFTKFSDPQAKNHFRSLCLAVEFSEEDFVLTLLDDAREKGTLTELLNPKGENKTTPLHLAASSEKYEIVKILLNAAKQEGILLEVMSSQDEDGATLLDLAARSGREDIVNMLLDAIREEGILTKVINSRGVNHFKLLFLAVEFSEEDFVLILLDNAREKGTLAELLNAKDINNSTPLHLAASSEKYEIVKILLNAAKQEGILLEVINSQDKDKMTPLHLAASNGEYEIVKILLNAAKQEGILLEVINSQDRDKMTPLHIAARDSREDIVNILLNAAKENGILLKVINSQDRDKMTPLDLAALFNEESVVNMLLKAIKEETILTEFINSQDEDRHVSLQVAEIEVTSLYTSKVHRK